jgi:hypothetical protein
VRLVRWGAAGAFSAAWLAAFRWAPDVAVVLLVVLGVPWLIVGVVVRWIDEAADSWAGASGGAIDSVVRGVVNITGGDDVPGSARVIQADPSYRWAVEFGWFGGRCLAVALVVVGVVQAVEFVASR